MTIKAIETRYKSYRFRSRLEARWAVFFDALGIEWEYEPEGLEFPDGTRYLPDFWLPKIKALVEIKPKPDDFNGQPWPVEGSKEAAAMSFLGRVENAHLPALFILFGTPGEAEPYEASSSYAGCTSGDSPYFFCECHECGSIGIQFDGRSARNRHELWCSVRGSDHDKNYNINSDRILSAYAAARGARFEHGENGGR